MIKRSIRNTPRTREEDIISRIIGMKNKTDRQKAIRAYAAFVYLFGNRVSEPLGIEKTEVVGYYEYERMNAKGVTKKILVPKTVRVSTDRKKREWLVEPMLAASLELFKGSKEVFTIDEAETMWVRSLPTFKTRKRPRRDMWVLVQTEKTLCQIVWTWARHKLSEGDDSVLFPLSRKSAYKAFRTYLGFNAFPHKLRDLRATKDAVVYGLDAKDLQEKYNWSRPDMAMYYGRKSQTDIIDKMLRRSKDYREQHD